MLEGRIDPGCVFDRTGTLDGVPEGYRLMNEREVLKFQIAFLAERPTTATVSDRRFIRVREHPAGFA